MPNRRTVITDTQHALLQKYLPAALAQGLRKDTLRARIITGWPEEYLLKEIGFRVPREKKTARAATASSALCNWPAIGMAAKP